MVRCSGLAEAFPSISVSGPFIGDVPGFHIPSESVFPSHQKVYLISVIGIIRLDIVVRCSMPFAPE